MKYKQTGNCPYCDAERGVQTIWGMSPQGWADLKERHDAGHPENEAKEQGEKKSKKKCKFCDEPQCGCFGRYCYTHRKNCPKPTSPLKEDIKEIEKLTNDDFDGSSDHDAIIFLWEWNIEMQKKINQLIDAINHLSSKEK